MEGGVANIELQGFKFWKEKSVEVVVTLGPMEQAILVYTKEKKLASSL